MESKSITVAVVDDDDRLRDGVLVPGLRDYGFDAVGFGSAAELYRAMIGGWFDVVLLDINLPGESGIAIADHLRSLKRRIGILMLSAQHDESHKVEALGRGADGYLEKPTSIKVLVATLHSLVRRIEPATSAMPRSENEFGPGPGPNAVARKAWYLTAPDGTAIALSVTEQRLFKALGEGKGEPISREALIAAVADDIYAFDVNHLDMIVHRLRKKIAASRDPGITVVTIRGLGYALTQG